MKSQGQKWAVEMADLIDQYGWEDFMIESAKLGHVQKGDDESTYNFIINGLSQDEEWEKCAIVRDCYGEYKFKQSKNS